MEPHCRSQDVEFPARDWWLPSAGHSVLFDIYQNETDSKVIWEQATSPPEWPMMHSPNSLQWSAQYPPELAPTSLAISTQSNSWLIGPTNPTIPNSIPNQSYIFPQLTEQTDRQMGHGNMTDKYRPLTLKIQQHGLIIQSNLAIGCTTAAQSVCGKMWTSTASKPSTTWFVQPAWLVI